jgi:hypothetical protein
MAQHDSIDPDGVELKQLVDPSEDLFNSANLLPSHTGLPFVVWISYSGGAQHDVRLKISYSIKVLPSDMASVAIRPDVRVVEGTMSRCSLNPDSPCFVLNHFPVFNCIVMALKSRTFVVKTRTN